MKILRSSRQSEYPTDFLIAHLKGRSGRLQVDWHAMAAADDPMAWGHPPWLVPYVRARGADGPWLFLAEEYSWVRRRMNSGLRRVLFPVFLYFELPNLLAMLRSKAGGNRMDRIDAVRPLSLLDPSVFALFRAGLAMEEVLQRLEQRLATISDRFAILGRTYAQGGFQALDRGLFAAFFGYCLNLSQPAIVTSFFRRLIDVINLLGLYKAVQWEAGTPPAIISGGTLSERGMKLALEKKTVEAILKRAGVADDALAVRSGVAMEAALYGQVGKVLRRHMHDPSGYGYLLFYLWGLFLFVRRYSLFLRGSRFHDQHPRATGLA